MTAESFWLTRDYVPQATAAEWDYAALPEVLAGLGAASVEPVPIPHDCPRRLPPRVLAPPRGVPRPRRPRVDLHAHARRRRGPRPRPRSTPGRPRIRRVARAQRRPARRRGARPRLPARRRRRLSGPGSAPPSPGDAQPHERLRRDRGDAHVTDDDRDDAAPTTRWTAASSVSPPSAASTRCGTSCASRSRTGPTSSRRRADARRPRAARLTDGSRVGELVR